MFMLILLNVLSAIIVIQRTASNDTTHGVKLYEIVFECLFDRNNLIEMGQDMSER